MSNGMASKFQPLFRAVFKFETLYLMIGKQQRSEIFNHNRPLQLLSILKISDLYSSSITTDKVSNVPKAQKTRRTYM